MRQVDYFPTPPWVVAQFLQAVELPGGFWLEPAYGQGAIVSTVDRIRDDVTWMTNDIAPGAILQLDYTNLPGPLFGPRFQVCITNPPFTLALLMACQAIRDAHVVAFLLRLNWLSGKHSRRGFLRAYPPEVWVLPDRPGFMSEFGRSKHAADAQEYAWFVWGRRDRAGKHEMLPPMTIEERRSWDETTEPTTV